MGFVRKSEPKYHLATTSASARRTREDSAAMRNQNDEGIASNRNEVEGDESAPVSPTIGEHSSGIGIDRADQSAQSVVKTNDEDARAKSLEIFRNESHP